MKTGDDDGVRLAVAAQAADWWLENKAGPLPERSRVAFMAWLRTSPLHVEEYLRIAAAAQALHDVATDPAVSLDALLAEANREDRDNVVSFDATVLPQGTTPQPPVPSARAPAAHAGLWAAGVAAAMLAGWALYRAGGFDLPGQDESYQTVHGEQHSWRLADGSTLQLNSDTAVQVHFDRGERRVQVLRGQACFTIAKEARRRFRVTAGATDVIAVGTQFDVYRRDDAALVTVVEGHVAVFAAGAPAGSAGSALPEGALRLGAGEQLRVSSAGVAGETRRIDLGTLEAWRAGRIVFDQRPLGEVADEFNRYAPVPIGIEDPVLRKLPISGSFEVRDVESFIRFLRATDGITITRTATRVQVTPTAGAPPHRPAATT